MVERGLPTRDRCSSRLSGIHEQRARNYRKLQGECAVRCPARDYCHPFHEAKRLLTSSPGFEIHSVFYRIERRCAALR